MTVRHAALARAMLAAALCLTAVGADAQSRITIGFVLPDTGT